MNNTESSLCKTIVKHFYEEVINDVISGIREKFIDEGIDEEVIQELKQTWEAKLKASQAIDADNANVNADLDQQQQVQEGKEEMENKKVPLQIILPSQSDGNIEQKIITIQVPQSIVEGNYICNVLSGPLISATMSLPPPIAAVVLQHHVDAALMSLQYTSGTIKEASLTETNNKPSQSQTQSALLELQSQPSTSGMNTVSHKSHYADLPALEQEEAPENDENVYKTKKKKMKKNTN
ncbi:hypothetical protein ILUMI_25558 [Ignelater luminosus]|uniref:Transcription initiation factor IIA subunit 1 n=1 Tax=Ignelater luminosus TaxID=2038154 RepID=A0A8K0FZU0_IGNLU|nr:hypothetical protein ILUMI_25558 [Ignelater luminosus]